MKICVGALSTENVVISNGQAQICQLHIIVPLLSLTHITALAPTFGIDVTSNFKNLFPSCVIIVNPLITKFASSIHTMSPELTDVEVSVSIHGLVI